LRKRAAELHLAIKPLRAQLEPLQSEWTAVTSRRMELEELTADVRKMPYWGPRATKARDRKGKLETAREMIGQLTSVQRQEVLAALQGMA
jgi:hypothetical protein